MDHAASPKQREVHAGRVFARLMRALGEERGRPLRNALLAGWMASGMLGMTIGLTVSGLLGAMTQAAADRRPETVVSLLLFSVALYVVMMAVNAILTYTSGRFRCESLYALRLRTERRIATAAYGWLERQKPGDLLERANGDVDRACAYVAGDMPELMLIGMKAILSIAVILSIHPLAAGAYLVMLPLIWLMQGKNSKPIEKASVASREAKGAATAEAMDALTNLMSVRAYGLEEEMLRRYQAKQQAHFRLDMRTWAIMLLRFIPGNIASLLPLCALCLIGAASIFAGRMGVGELVTMIAIASPFSEISWKFIDRIGNLRKSAAGAKRIFAIWDAPMEKADIGLPLERAGEVALAFDEVFFSYDGERDVLKGLSFRLKAGERVALVGRSGAGKSTVLKLAAALYRPTGGAVRLYGQDAAMAAPAALRGDIAYLAQDTFLFPGSLKENIALARRGAPEAHVLAAAASAGLDFVETWPQGLDTPAGERGAKVSGGQRQRVAIARAMLRGAPIVLLDEATSALDNIAEAVIQKELDSLLAGRAALIVAHRLSSIRHADRILVLDQGRIAEEGDHRTLMAADGLYAALYRSQEEGGLPA